MEVNELQTTLTEVLSAIDGSCRRAGREPQDVKLMAVSKMHSANAIRAAVEAGLLLFGENRVQEFEGKAAELADICSNPAAGPAFHLIGHLQSNKAAKAAALFDSIDTEDSLRLAERLNDAAAKLGKVLPVLLEIKLSHEPAKTGLSPAGSETEQLLERLPGFASLKVNGLMTVAPLDDDTATARECFRRLRKLRDEWAHRHSGLDLRELSMGMSGDFEIAIEEGSTMVRLGTAIFGRRQPAS